MLKGNCPPFHPSRSIIVCPLSKGSGPSSPTSHWALFAKSTMFLFGSPPADFLTDKHIVYRCHDGLSKYHGHGR
jgi:hypothetical protein